MIFTFYITFAFLLDFDLALLSYFPRIKLRHILPYRGITGFVINVSLFSYALKIASVFRHLTAPFTTTTTLPLEPFWVCPCKKKLLLENLILHSIASV